MPPEAFAESLGGALVESRKFSNRVSLFVYTYDRTLGKACLAGLSVSRSL
jgi:hypothetical protein